MEDGTILELKDGSYVSEDAEITLTLDEAEEQILAGKVEIVSEAKAKAKVKEEEEDDSEEDDKADESKKAKKESEEDGDDDDEEEVDEAKKAKKVSIDINWASGKGSDKKLGKKYGIKIKDDDNMHADVTGDPKKILKFLRSADYDMDMEDIEDLYPELLEGFVNEEVELSFDDLDITADVNEMFGDNEFSDEFKTKASVIYEAAVKSTIKTHAEKIEEGTQAKIEESVRAGLEDITANLNSYLDYIAEEWMKENQVAVESGIKTEITEGFMEGLKGLFSEAYVDMPEEKRDLVAEQAEKITELESQLDEELNRKIAMKAELHEANMAAVFDQVSEDLTETEKAKLKTLAEDLTFESNEDYATKLNILKENYFKTDEEDTSETPVVEKESTDPISSDSMSTYINAIANMTDK